MKNYYRAHLFLNLFNSIFFTHLFLNLFNSIFFYVVLINFIFVGAVWVWVFAITVSFTLIIDFAPIPHVNFEGFLNFFFKHVLLRNSHRRKRRACGCFVFLSLT